MGLLGPRSPAGNKRDILSQPIPFGQFLRCHTVSADIRADTDTPGQPPVRMDAVSVLPPSDHLCLFRHCPAHIRVIPGGPQFILIHLIRGKGGAVDDFPPGPERAVLHADPLIVIEKARQGVIRVLGVSPYVHGPLGGVIAVKFLLFYFDPLLWLNSFVCLPSS